MPGATRHYRLPVERPPAVFSKVSRVESIAKADAKNVYYVTMCEPGGEAQSALFTLHLDGIRHASTDWDIFWHWPGDAESQRAVVRQVFDFHKAHGEAP